jgi:hypothetical protein
MVATREATIPTLWRTLDLVYDSIRLADAKAGSILFMDGGIATIVSTRVVDAQTVLRGNYVLIAIIAIAALLWLTSISFAVLAVRPRLGSQAGDSLLYFGDIARTYPAGFREYADAAESGLATEQQIMDQISKQIWANSRAAVRKHQNARISMDCLIATVVLTLGTGLVYFLRSMM